MACFTIDISLEAKYNLILINRKEPTGHSFMVTDFYVFTWVTRVRS